jgi:hypothetical protein
MRPTAALALLALAALSAPALADTYPVSGRYGVGQSRDNGPIDCSKLRVIAFNGDQRTDSKGGVPAYRNVSVTPVGSSFRIVDAFNTAQINARATLTLRKVDADRIEINQQPGGLLKLQRCK